METENTQEVAAQPQEPQKIDVVERMKNYREGRKSAYPTKDVMTGEDTGEHYVKTKREGTEKTLEPADPKAFDERKDNFKKNLNGEPSDETPEEPKEEEPKEEEPKEEFEEEESEEEEDENPYGVDEEEGESEDISDKDKIKKAVEEQVAEILGVKSDELKEFRFQKAQIEQEKAKLAEERKQVEEMLAQHAQIEQMREGEEFAKKADMFPKFEFDPDAILADENQPEYLRELAKDDPDIVRAMSHIVNDHFQKVLQDSMEFSKKAQEKEAEEAKLIESNIVNAVDAIKKEDKFDMNRLFRSPEFAAYTNDPEREAAHAEYLRRFGFGTVEYFRHIKDDFMKHRKSYMISSKNKKKAKAKTEPKKDNTKKEMSPMERYKARMAKKGVR